MFVKNLNIGLFQKKKNRQGGFEGGGVGVEDIFFEPPPPSEFLGLLLYPWKFQKNKASPLETPQNCVTVHPSEILKPKTKTPGNSTLFLINAYL